MYVSIDRFGWAAELRLCLCIYMHIRFLSSTSGWMIFDSSSFLLFFHSLSLSLTLCYFGCCCCCACYCYWQCGSVIYLQSREFIHLHAVSKTVCVIFWLHKFGLSCLVRIVTGLASHWTCVRHAQCLCDVHTVSLYIKRNIIIYKF